MRIAFLVYDSRSGSTLLSREIARRSSRTLVTSEIGFNELVRRGGRWLRGASVQDVVDCLTVNRNLANSGLSEVELVKLVTPAKARESISRLISVVLEGYRARSECPFATTILVKNGNTADVLPALRRSLPASRFVHIVRDPRAVISSKLRTPRPYYPFETMAWGGALVAALRWRQIVSRFRELVEDGVGTEVRYEDLVADPNGVVDRVLSFLGEQRVDEGYNYRIPEKELQVHQRVLVAGVNEDRLSSWRRELSTEDRKTIECVLLREIQDRGFEKPLCLSTAGRAAALARGIVVAGKRVSMHFAAHVWLATTQRIGLRNG